MLLAPVLALNRFGAPALLKTRTCNLKVDFIQRYKHYVLCDKERKMCKYFISIVRMRHNSFVRHC